MLCNEGSCSRPWSKYWSPSSWIFLHLFISSDKKRSYFLNLTVKFCSEESVFRIWQKSWIPSLPKQKLNTKRIYPDFIVITCYSSNWHPAGTDVTLGLGWYTLDLANFRDEIYKKLIIIIFYWILVYFLWKIYSEILQPKKSS